MKNNTPRYLLLISIFSLFLSACGGSESTPQDSVRHTIAPAITITGSSNINLALGTTYTDLGVTAVDSFGGTLTVSASSTVDINIEGTYRVTYQTSDSSGNIATAIRTVVVVLDATAPVITITGSNTINLVLNATYTEPVVTAVDSLEGVVTVSSSGTVDTSIDSIYKIIYQASDTSGNIATTTLTVNVINDTTAPTITITGGNAINLVLNATYTEPVVTAVDFLEGTVTVSASGSVDTNNYGTYKIIYQASDTSGNIATATRTVNVVRFNAATNISTSKTGSISVFAIDLDGDGDNDILSSLRFNNTIAWHHNNGSGVFPTSTIISTNTTSVRSVFAIDLDGDGDNDVLSASFSDNTIAWYENDGSGGFSTQKNITTDALDARSVFAIDLDGDGDNDVLSASSDDNTIAWYENDGSANFSSENIINNDAGGAFSVFAIDLDGDGDNDVLSASAGDNTIAWYKNNGSGGFSTKNIINNNASDAFSVFAIDLDGDGDNDVLSASSGDGKIIWYKNIDDSDDFSTGTTINDDTEADQAVFAIDLDGDGDNDVLSVGTKELVFWYENDGSATFSSGKIINERIGNRNDTITSIFAIDLDADGDNDVLYALLSTDEVHWHENAGNETINPPSITLDADAVDEGNNLNSNIPPALIPNNAGGYVDTWSISPTLNGTPSFNTRSGALYGTYISGAADNLIEHTITATNAGGSDTIVLDINRPTP